MQAFNRVAWTLACSLAVASGQTIIEPAPQPSQPNDTRTNLVREFLQSKNSPLASYADILLQVADQHSLDWRLLPSLAVVETAGVRNIRNNNAFGWGNGRIRFASVPESISFIAERLANSAAYRNKTTEGKLRTYNPVNRNYAARVLDLMAMFGPVGVPAAAAEVVSAAVESSELKKPASSVR
jgi:hypothetical protein